MDYSVQSLTPTNRKNNLRKRRLTEALWGYFFILPQIIGLLAFSLIPLITVFYLSTVSWDGLGEMEFVGFQNYLTQLAPGGDLQVALVNTVYYTILVVPTSIFLSLLVALGLNNVRGKTIYRALYFMPHITSSVAVSVLWLWLMNGDFGLINALLDSWFHIQGPDWLTDSRFVIPSVVVVTIWGGLGLTMVLFLAGLQAIPAVYFEAARIDGAGRLQIFWKVTLPLLSPTVFLVTVLTFISSFQVFDQIFVLTGGGPGRDSYTMVYHIYRTAFELFQFGSASASAVVLFLIILALTMVQFLFQARWVHYEG